MFVRRLPSSTTAAAAAAATTGSMASTTARPSLKTWEEALALVAKESTPANQAAALQFVAGLAAAAAAAGPSSKPPMPGDAARRLVSHCAAHQRYSDAAVAAAFPHLCDASRAVGAAPDACSDILQRAMARKAYVDAGHFGPYLRLVNATHNDPIGEVNVQWAWMRHTRARFCPIARSAVVEATASSDVFARAREIEGAMRTDGVLLREEGLLGLLRAWPRDRWNEAISTVKFWRAEHRRVHAGNEQDEGENSSVATLERDGRPGVESTVALIRVLADSRKFGYSARVINAVAAREPDFVASLNEEHLALVLSAVLPAWSPSNGDLTDRELEARESTDDLIKSLLLAARNAMDAPSFALSTTSTTSESTATFGGDDDSAATDGCALVGYVCAGAAILKDRTLLSEAGRLLVARNVTQGEFDRILRATVAPLRGAAWQVGKLAVAELVRTTKLAVPVDVRSRLLVLHQAVEDDKGLVLDALFGTAPAPAPAAAAAASAATA